MPWNEGESQGLQRVQGGVRQEMGGEGMERSSFGGLSIGNSSSSEMRLGECRKLDADSKLPRTARVSRFKVQEYAITHSNHPLVQSLRV